MFGNYHKYKGDCPNFMKNCVLKGLLGYLSPMRRSRPEWDMTGAIEMSFGTTSYPKGLGSLPSHMKIKYIRLDEVVNQVQLHRCFSD